MFVFNKCLRNISLLIYANLFDKDEVNDGGFQLLTLNAVKRSSSFELRLHPVQVPKATKIYSVSIRNGPFGVILSPLPTKVNIPRQKINISCHKRSCLVATPRKLSWSSPSLSHNVRAEHVSESILEDGAVLFAALVDDSHFATSYCKVGVKEQIYFNI